MLVHIGNLTERGPEGSCRPPFKLIDWGRINDGLVQGIPQDANPNHWEIPLEHSVEPGRHQLISVVPRPVHGQFKHRGRVQPIEASKNFKSLNEQAAKTPLLEGEESEIRKSPLIPLVTNWGDQLGSSVQYFFETLSIYPSNRRPKLGTVLKQRSYQDKHRLLVPVAKHLLYAAQNIYAFCSALIHCPELLRSAMMTTP